MIPRRPSPPSPLWKSASAALLALTALTLAGCLRTSSETPTAAAPIALGALVAQTGRSAFIGIPEAQTLRAYVDDINAAGGIDGRPLVLRLVDTGGAPLAAAEAARALAARPDVVAIIGPSTTAETLAVIPIVQTARIPLVSLAAGNEVVHPVRAWVFKDTPSDTHAVECIYDHLTRRGLRRIAVLTADDAFGQGGEMQLRERAAVQGVRIVSRLVFGTETPDAQEIRAFLRRVRGSDVQALVVWGTHPGPAMIARISHEEGLPQVRVFGHGISSRAFIEQAGPASEGVLFPGCPLLVCDALPWNHPLRAVETQYQRWYEARFHEAPSAFGGHAWDALNLLRDALRVTLPMRRGEPSRAKIRAFLEETRNFVGTGGRYHFSPADHNGLSRDAFVMIRIESGDWILAR